VSLCSDGQRRPVTFRQGRNGQDVRVWLRDGDVYGLSRTGQGAHEVGALRAAGGCWGEPGAGSCSTLCVARMRLAVACSAA
jgi:hypothetical protein